MYARGATPTPSGRSQVCVRARGRSPPRVSRAETSPSKARSTFRFLAPGGGNARATMTFALVKRIWPSGSQRWRGRRWDRKGMRLVDAGVDHADLHPPGPRSRDSDPRRQERRSAAGSGRAVVCSERSRASRTPGRSRSQAAVRSGARPQAVGHTRAGNAERARREGWSGSRRNARCSAAMRASVPGAWASEGEARRRRPRTARPYNSLLQSSDVAARSTPPSVRTARISARVEPSRVIEG